MSNIEDKVDPYHPDFDWFAFLDQDIELISRDHLEEANALADNWVTCACGQLCKALPRTAGNAPEDKELDDLGMQFAHAMSEVLETQSNTVRDEAVEILKAIEARTTLLLQEMKSAAPSPRLR